MVEVDAVLAAMNHDRVGIVDAVTGMSLDQVARFGQQLHELQNVLAHVALCKSGLVRS
jgi:hypothetical protein